MIFGKVYKEYFYRLFMRKIGDDKKGQQMTLGTIISIVLGITVLVFLIFGFSTGWGNLWQRITGLGGGEINVDTTKTSCALTCQQNNVDGFCRQERKVVIEDGYSTRTNCNALSSGEVNFYKGGTDTKTKQVDVKIDPCSISCA